jgi:hypothetical protein
MMWDKDEQNQVAIDSDWIQWIISLYEDRRDKKRREKWRQKIKKQCAKK